MRVMLDFLNSFKSLIKSENIHTDNNVFKLHYRFTVITLIVFSILVTSKQYFGDPISCDVQGEQKSVIDTYCWIYGTYTIKQTLAADVLPGLGNSIINRHGTRSPWKETLESDPDNPILSQKYYQWVCIVLCFQALMFYVPRYLWKAWEGGRLRLLVKDLGGPLVSPNWDGESRRTLINYLLTEQYSHNLYCLRFTFCEILNFINVICQILLLNWFLNNQFLKFGLTLATFNDVNPAIKIFPKLTKCTYFKFGPSGTLQSRDALCVLPLNVINEKLFVSLWIWFYLLSILSAIALIYRALVLFIPKVRMYLLMAQARYLHQSSAEAIVKRLSFGDYFVLCQLGKNLNLLVYKDLVFEIGIALTSNKSFTSIPE